MCKGYYEESKKIHRLGEYILQIIDDKGLMPRI